MRSRSFPCRPASVTAARLFVRDALGEESREVAESAELMTSELATNCVRHARTGFELEIEAQDQIRIEVRDRGEGSPRLLSPAARDARGRGLRIVDAMSNDWGVTATPHGKSVWFTLAAGCRT